MRKSIWNTTAILNGVEDDLSDLAGVGATPWEERDDEDGMEAPIRETRHGLRGDWVRDHTFAV